MARFVRAAASLTLDLLVVGLRFPHQQCRRLPVEGVCGVGVQQQLRQEGLEHVQQICSSTKAASGAAGT